MIHLMCDTEAICKQVANQSTGSLSPALSLGCGPSVLASRGTLTLSSVKVSCFHTAFGGLT